MNAFIPRVGCATLLASTAGLFALGCARPPADTKRDTARQPDERGRPSDPQERPVDRDPASSADAERRTKPASNKGAGPEFDQTRSENGSETASGAKNGQQGNASGNESATGDGTAGNDDSDPEPGERSLDSSSNGSGSGKTGTSGPKSGARRSEPSPVFQGRKPRTSAVSPVQAAAMAKRLMAEARAAGKQGDVAAGCQSAIGAYEAAAAHGSSNPECRKLMREAETFLESIGNRQTIDNVPTKFE